MSHAKLLTSFIAFLIVIICNTSAFAQVSSTVWLTIRDDVGGHDSLVFGTHQFATYCIDTALGENYSAPYPLGGFYAVFQSILGRANCFTTLGIIKKDLREFTSISKKDTFYIDFASLDSIGQQPNVNITLRWPDAAYLSQRCDSMFLQDRNSGNVISGKIDMFAQDSVILTGAYDPNGANPTAPTVKLEIFRYGVHIWVDGVPKTNQTVPASLTVRQNYPNPFNPTTSISLIIPKQTHVRLQVFGLLGQLITTIVDENKSPGTYTVTWDASTQPTGLYFFRMTAGGIVQTKKAMLIR